MLSLIIISWETIAATVTIEINRAISWTTVKGWWVKLCVLTSVV